MSKILREPKTKTSLSKERIKDIKEDFNKGQIFKAENKRNWKKFL